MSDDDDFFALAARTYIGVDPEKAISVIAKALEAQGAAYPRAGATLVLKALLDGGLTLCDSKPGVKHDNRIENLELWVKPQLAGQRVEDLVDFVVDAYPDYVKAALKGRPYLFAVKRQNEKEV